jgi:hypothetical protein
MRRAMIPEPDQTQVDPWAGMGINSWDNDGRMLTVLSRLIDSATRQGEDGRADLRRRGGPEADSRLDRGLGRVRHPPAPLGEIGRGHPDSPLNEVSRHAGMMGTLGEQLLELGDPAVAVRPFGEMMADIEKLSVDNCYNPNRETLSGQYRRGYRPGPAWARTRGAGGDGAEPAEGKARGQDRWPGARPARVPLGARRRPPSLDDRRPVRPHRPGPLTTARSRPTTGAGRPRSP